MSALALVPTITTAGFAALANANGNGLALDITHIQIGDGAYTPSGGTAALLSPKATIAIAGGSANANGCTIAAVFPAPVDTYFVKEVGFWSGDPAASGSVLFAVYSSTTSLAWRSPTSGDWTPVYTMAWGALPANSLNIVVDVNQSAAIQAMVNLIATHETSSDPHPQYTTAAEATAIASSVVSSSIPQTYLGGTTLTGVNYSLTGGATTAPDLFAVKFVAANPASATLTVGATAYTLVDQDGTALPAGNLSAGDTRVLVKDGTTLKVQAADDVLNAEMLLELVSAQVGTFAGTGKPTAAPTLANPQTELVNSNGEVFRWNGSSWYLAGNGYSVQITGTKGLSENVTSVDATWTAPRSGRVHIATLTSWYKAGASPSTPVQFLVLLQKNGSDIAFDDRYFSVTGGSSLTNAACINALIDVNLGDVIALKSYQASGGSLGSGIARLSAEYTK